MCAYEDFHISIASKDFITHSIKVGRGVLQGDCLSPLLFNLCINTLVNTVKNEKLNCFGYTYDFLFQPRNWFQFADDTAIVTSSEEDNQLLINGFRKWCTWADLSVRIDKCHVFGIKKSNTKSCQYSPYVTINQQRIPPVQIDDSFTYLGKEFNFGMDCSKIKENILDEIWKHIKKIDVLPLHPKNKILIVQRFVFSKIKWSFSIYDLSETWVKQKVDDAILNRYYRKWLNMPISGNISHLCMPTKCLGLKMSTAKQIYNNCKLTVRRILKCSTNDDARQLFNLTVNNNRKIDNIVTSVDKEQPNYKTKKVCDSIMKKRERNTIWDKFMGLNEQCKLISFIVDECFVSDIISWKNISNSLPTNIFRFCRRYLVFSLANNSNLHRWKISSNGLCSLCKLKLQTQMHVFNNCEHALDRYTWRHDSVLFTITEHLKPRLADNTSIFVDSLSLDYPSPKGLFSGKVPDIVLIQGDKIIVVELTCPFETNLLSSRNYKAERYKELKQLSLVPCNELDLVLVEISSLGFVTKKGKDFKNLLNNFNCDSNKVMITCAEVAIRCSYYIYCRRNKDWLSPGILKFI
jgi:hypothetical protein